MMNIPRSLLAPLCVVVAALLATIPLHAGPSPIASDPAIAAIEKAVLDANAQMTQAANSLNTDAFFDFIADTDRGMIVQNGMIFRTRHEAYEAVKRGLQGVAKIDRKFENPQVTVIAPDVALLVSAGSVAATLADGRELNRRFAVSLVFVLRDGRWKVLHGHYSTLPNRPESPQ